MIMMGIGTLEPTLMSLFFSWTCVFDENRVFCLGFIVIVVIRVVSICKNGVDLGFTWVYRSSGKGIFVNLEYLWAPFKILFQLKFSVSLTFAKRYIWGKLRHFVN